MKHLACIMDGNRRWAKKRALQPWLGHKEGAQSVKLAVAFCLKKKIGYLSLYTFSIENFNRSPEECSYLFKLITDHAQENSDLFLQNNICVNFIGDRSLFPASVVNVIEQLEQETKHNTALHLNFLFCYGGRQEVVSSVKKIVQDVQQGLLQQTDISEQTITNYLWTKSMPDPDLIIRTGGAMRLSNFLLYQAAYSELYFLDCLWPDISENHLEKAYEQFNASQRNFGA